MIVKRGDRLGVPRDVVDGSYHLVLEGVSKPLFGFDTIVVYAYVLKAEISTSYSPSYIESMSVPFGPGAMVFFAVNAPSLRSPPQAPSTGGKMIWLCRAALEGTGVLPPPPFDADWRLKLTGFGFSLDDALFGSRIAVEKKEFHPTESTFCPLVCEERVSSEDAARVLAKTTRDATTDSPGAFRSLLPRKELVLRRDVALGVPGAAEVLVDFLSERGLISGEIAAKMLIERSRHKRVYLDAETTGLSDELPIGRSDTPPFSRWRRRSRMG